MFIFNFKIAFIYSCVGEHTDVEASRQRRELGGLLLDPRD